MIYVTLLDKTDYFDEIMFEMFTFITTACIFPFMNKSESVNKPHKCQRGVNTAVKYFILTIAVLSDWLQLKDIEEELGHSKHNTKDLNCMAQETKVILIFIFNLFLKQQNGLLHTCPSS